MSRCLSLCFLLFICHVRFKPSFFIMCPSSSAKCSNWAWHRFQKWSEYLGRVLENTVSMSPRSSLIIDGAWSCVRIDPLSLPHLINARLNLYVLKIGAYTIRRKSPECTSNHFWATSPRGYGALFCCCWGTWSLWMGVNFHKTLQRICYRSITCLAVQHPHPMLYKHTAHRNETITSLHVTLLITWVYITLVEYYHQPERNSTVIHLRYMSLVFLRSISDFSSSGEALCPVS